MFWAFDSDLSFVTPRFVANKASHQAHPPPPFPDNNMIAVAALLSALLLFSATPHTLSAADQCANTDSTMPSDKAKQFVQDKITTNKVCGLSRPWLALLLQFLCGGCYCCR